MGKGRGLFRAMAALVLVGGLATCGDRNDSPAPSSGPVTFAGMVFGQVLEESSESSQLRLTPGKPASVRATIVGATGGMASPVVMLAASNDSTLLGTLTMVGPATLPTAVSAGNASETFNAVLPGAWVRPGLTVEITYIPTGSDQPVSIVEQPLVGHGTSLNLVLVPIQIGSSTGSIPTTPFAVRDLLAMSFPYPHENISVETRSPLAIAGLTELSSSADVSRVLAEIEATRALENPGAIYYGLVADRAMRTVVGFGRLIGVAYVNSPEYSPHTWKLSALGTDSMLALAVPDSLGLPWTWWARIMIHELGHVHGRHHAPCGGAGGADPAFPYSNGALGSQGIYASFYNDATFGSVAPPATMTDVMGYCEGVWFSDYNYYAIQRFAERYSGAGDTSAGYAGSALSVPREQSFLVLTGEIASSGVTLRPASLSSRPVGEANPAATDYDIVLRTADGRELVQPLAPYVSSELPDRVSFRVGVPAGTRISQVQIRQSGVALFHETAAADSGRVSWHRDSTGLSVEWDSAVEPYLSVLRVTRQGSRAVLRLFASGGRVHVPAEEFADAGIELLLSTRLNARTVRAIDP